MSLGTAQYFLGTEAGTDFLKERAVGVRKQLAELLASLASFPQDYLYQH